MDLTRSSGEQTVRAFIALEIDDAARDRIAAAILKLRAELPELRFVMPRNIHLTLRFLGASRPPQLRALVSALEDGSGRCPPARVAFGGLGMFPERGSPRVLWLDLPLTSEMLALQAACERSARALGFQAEKRAFRSHLTLGRWRCRVPRPRLSGLDLGEARIEHVTLFRSQLHPTGSIYTPIARFALGRIGRLETAAGMDPAVLPVNDTPSSPRSGGA